MYPLLAELHSVKDQDGDGNVGMQRKQPANSQIASVNFPETILLACRNLVARKWAAAVERGRGKSCSHQHQALQNPVLLVLFWEDSEQFGWKIHGILLPTVCKDKSEDLPSCFPGCNKRAWRNPRAGPWRSSGITSSPGLSMTKT